MAREMAKLEEEINRDAVKGSNMIAGDKGVFLSEMTDSEYEEYDRLENKGWKGFYKKIKNIGKNETNNE